MLANSSSLLFDPHHDLILTRWSGGTEDYPFDGLGEQDRERVRGPREQEPTNATSRGNPLQQLFDHLKDDSVHFSALARPQIAQQFYAQIAFILDSTTLKHPPNDHVSASSTSFHTMSIAICHPVRNKQVCFRVFTKLTSRVRKKSDRSCY